MGKSICLAALLAAAVFTCSHGEEDGLNTDSPAVPKIQEPEPDPDCRPGDQCIMDLRSAPKLPADTRRGVCVIAAGGGHECWDVCNQLRAANLYKVSDLDPALNTAMADGVTQARAQANPGIICPVPPEPVEVPCNPGRACRNDGKAGEGTCVQTTDAAGQSVQECWDTCNEKYEPEDYCGEPADRDLCIDRVKDMRSNKIDPGCGPGGWWWGWVIGICLLCCLCGILGGMFGYSRQLKPSRAPDPGFITEEVWEVYDEPDDYPAPESRSVPMQAAPMATQPYYQTRAPISGSQILPGTYSMGPQAQSSYFRPYG